MNGCAKCDAPTAISGDTGTKAATCTKCGNSKIVKTDKGTTSCVTEEECTGTEGFFVKEGDPKTCVACTENCKTCSGAAGQCTSCKTDTPYLKKADNSQTGTCVDAAGCTGTYYIDEAAKTCSTCEKDGAVACASCEDSQKFRLNKRSCVAKCPTNSQAGYDGVCVCNTGLPPTQAPLRALTAIPAALHTVPPMRTATRPAPKAHTS